MLHTYFQCSVTEQALSSNALIKRLMIFSIIIVNILGPGTTESIFWAHGYFIFDLGLIITYTLSLVQTCSQVLDQPFQACATHVRPMPHHGQSHKYGSHAVWPLVCTWYCTAVCTYMADRDNHRVQKFDVVVNCSLQLESMFAAISTQHHSTWV